MVVLGDGEELVVRDDVVVDVDVREDVPLVDGDDETVVDCDKVAERVGVEHDDADGVTVPQLVDEIVAEPLPE